MIFLRTEDGAEKWVLRDLRLAEEISVSSVRSLKEHIGNVAGLELTGVELHRCQGLEGWSCRLSVRTGNPNLTVRWLIPLYSRISAYSGDTSPPARAAAVSIWPPSLAPKEQRV